MNIQFKPTDPNYPPDRRNNTNIGEHLPGEIVGVGPDQEAEAKRLVENGDYVVTDEAPNSNEIAAALPKAMEKWNKAKAKRDEEAAAKAAANPPVATTRVGRAAENLISERDKSKQR